MTMTIMMRMMITMIVMMFIILALHYRGWSQNSDSGDSDDVYHSCNCRGWWLGLLPPHWPGHGEVKDGDRQHCFNHHHYRFENIQQDANVKADVDVKGGLLLKQAEQSHHTTPPLARSTIFTDHRQICCNHHHHHRHHHQVTLAIDDLGPGDEGEYACKAENPWGDTTCTLVVIILFSFFFLWSSSSPSPMLFITFPSDQSRATGDKACTTIEDSKGVLQVIIIIVTIVIASMYNIHIIIIIIISSLLQDEAAGLPHWLGRLCRLRKTERTLAASCCAITSSTSTTSTTTVNLSISADYAKLKRTLSGDPLSAVNE